MPRLPCASMLGASPTLLSDITNVFCCTPRQLCHDLCKELCKGPAEKALPALEGTALVKAAIGSASCTAPATRPSLPTSPSTPTLLTASKQSSVAPTALEAKVPQSLAAPSDLAGLEAAINAVCSAIDSEGMDSKWTSQLAAQLTEASRHGSAELRSVLNLHGWSGAQFAGPPDRELLLEDLKRAHNSVAAAAAAATVGSARSGRRPGRTGGA